MMFAATGPAREAERHCMTSIGADGRHTSESQHIKSVETRLESRAVCCTCPSWLAALLLPASRLASQRRLPFR